MTCLYDLESNDHLFIHCPLSWNLWEKLLNMVNANWVAPQTFDFSSRWKALQLDRKAKILWNLHALMCQFGGKTIGEFSKIPTEMYHQFGILFSIWGAGLKPLPCFRCCLLISFHVIKEQFWCLKKQTPVYFFSLMILSFADKELFISPFWCLLLLEYAIWSLILDPSDPNKCYIWTVGIIFSLCFCRCNALLKLWISVQAGM